MAETPIANVRFRIWGWENNFPKYLRECKAELHHHIIMVSILAWNGSAKLQAWLHAWDDPKNFRAAGLARCSAGRAAASFPLLFPLQVAPPPHRFGICRSARLFKTNSTRCCHWDSFPAAALQVLHPEMGPSEDYYPDFSCATTQRGVNMNVNLAVLFKQQEILPFPPPPPA